MNSWIRQSLGQTESITKRPERIAKRPEEFIHATGIHNLHETHPLWPDGDHPDVFPPGVMEDDIFTPNQFRLSFHNRMSIFDTTVVPLAVDFVQLGNGFSSLV